MVPFEAKAIEEFMAKLDCRKIPGVGRVSEGTLKNMGIITCKDAIENAASLKVNDWFSLVYKSLGCA